MRWRGALVLLAGCGRIAFTPVGDGAADGSTCTPEICNGIDDNCDGLVDEGCPCTPFDVSQPVSSTRFDFVWTGTDYVQLFGSRMRRFDGTTGQLVSDLPSPAPIPTGSVPRSTAWTGSLVAVRNGVSLVQFSIDGTIELAGPALAPGSATVASLRWRGDGFDVAWVDIAESPRRLRYQNVSPQLEAIGPAMVLGDPRSNLGSLMLPGSGSSGWILWDGDSTTLQAVAVTDGVPDTTVHSFAVAFEFPEARDAAVAGAGFALIGARNLVRYDAQAGPLGSTTTPGADFGQDVVWSGSDFEVVQAIGVGGPILQIVHIAADGTLGATDVLFSDTATSLGGNSPGLVTAAGRAFTNWQYEPGTAPVQTRLIQRCM